MEETILISYLNDFIFCPASIYFHKLYGGLETTLYQSTSQINGKEAHKAVDTRKYSTRKNVLQGIDIYSEELGIEGKIDVFDIEKGLLTERKRKINKIFDGYIFQLYAQYYSLTEMGYQVNNLALYSMEDNKKYEIKLPQDDKNMDEKFRKLIDEIHRFDLSKFKQTNKEKCKMCIYDPSCDRSLYVE